MHTETILIVDDEPIVRKLIRVCLKGRGYTILEAESGSAAINVCLSHKGAIDLALIDVMMPGIHGPQLQRMLNKLDPNLKILYMSGFPHIEAINRGMGDFLSKPFMLETLFSKIRVALAAPSNEEKESGEGQHASDQSSVLC